MSLGRSIGQSLLNAAWYATHPRALMPSTPSASRRVRRSFSGAQVSRLTQSWTAGQVSLDVDLNNHLRRLRNRSRDLAQNNEFARGWLHSVRTNLIGPQGISLQVRARENDGRLDQAANTLIEERYAAAGQAGQWDVTGRLSRAEGERLIAESVARDGEVLIRKVRGYRRDQPYAVQLLEADLLDEDHNARLGNGNQVRMGVEVDAYFRPVAYHLLSEHPGDTTYVSRGRRYERIPADDIVHAFVPLRALQTRGVPWMHAAMMALRDLGGYRESAIIAARVGAAKMGFYTTVDGLPEGATDPNVLAGGNVDADGAFVHEVEPGTFETLPEGYKLESWDPQYPHEQFGEFNKATLRGIAAALGASYHTLANDLEAVNFSSGRLGAQAERDLWMCLQDWIISSVSRPLFADWLRYELASGRLPLPAAKFDKFNAPAFSGRRWQSIDPLKDVEADIAAIDAGLKSRIECIRARGRDPDEVWQETEIGNEMMAQHGVTAAARSPAPVATTEANAA